MNKAHIIGIQSSSKNKIISETIHYLLEDNKHNCILVKDKEIKFQDNILNKTEDNLLKILNKANKETVVIVDSDSFVGIEDTIYLNALDLLVDTNLQSGEIPNPLFYDLMKKNGTVVTNTENSEIFNYTNKLVNNIIVTCGLSSRSTLTTSSIDINKTIDNNEAIRVNVCLQRGITNKYGTEIDPIEFPINYIPHEGMEHQDVLPIIATALINGLSVKEIQNSLKKLCRTTIKNIGCEINN